jgi:hypothetical protein
VSASLLAFLLMVLPAFALLVVGGVIGYLDDRRANGARRALLDNALPLVLFTGAVAVLVLAYLFHP